MNPDHDEQTTRDQRLDSVIADYLREIEAGRSPIQTELLTRHPDLASELKLFFFSHERLNRLGESIRRMNFPDARLAALRQFTDYELLQEIGRGGMGVVYKARQRSLNRLVALKMILAGQFASPSDVRRFRSEAEAVAALDHPNIVPVYEVGEHAGHHYFTMKLLRGSTLAEFASGFATRPRDATRLLAKVARTVHHAHQRGILHRDLKPANILLEPPASERQNDNGRAESEFCTAWEPYVTDFGLAKRLEQVSAVTEPGGFAGTLSYAAPEQVSSPKQVATIATDVYGLGAMLYTLLAGHPPFRGETPLETLRQIVEREPKSICLENPNVHRDLDAICFRCLEKDPARRYRSAEALAEDLERYVAGRPVQARPLSLGERGWRWCLRNPRAVGLIGAAILVASALGAAAWEVNGRTHARRLVQAVLNSSPGKLPTLIGELRPYRRWADSLFRAKIYDEQADAKVRLRARLALAQVDPSQTSYLLAQMRECSFDEFPLIRDAIKPHLSPAELGRLWQALRDPKESESVRFRAGLGLAAFAESSNWTQSDAEFLASQLVAAPPDEQRDLRSYLKPVRSHLVNPLQTLFREAQRESHREMAATALADFVSDDPVRLGQLLSDAIPAQYVYLFSALMNSPGNREPAAVTLRAIARQFPSSDLLVPDRIELGRRRASAAITLLRLDDRSALAEVLQLRDDPESLFQFVHGARARGVSAQLLIECLEQYTDESIRYAVLLALGEYAKNDLPPDSWQPLTDKLLDWYRSDPSSVIHGATGWLLRAWGLDERTEQIDRTPLRYDPTGVRQWFVEQIGDDFFTFIVFRRGAFQMGSPPTEPDRDDDEHSHPVTLTRSFALADRELTVEQWKRFCSSTGRDPQLQRKPPTPRHPITGHMWFTAAEYCRWLTHLSGLPETEQCYEPTDNLPQFRDGTPKSFPVNPNRHGFRLPNEAEWEYACRAGTTTQYYFGSNQSLLTRYACLLDTAGTTSQPVASLRPNPRGLFDMLGNVAEWCNDGHVDDLRPYTLDPLVPHTGTDQVFRGGAWNLDFRYTRSASRAAPKSMRNSGHGFRIVRTLEATEE